MPFVIQPIGKAYKFASASYSEIVNDQQFRQSLDRAISDIRGALDGKRNYQIYVQGKASGGRYNGQLVEGYKYTSMQVMGKKDGNFGPELIERTYGPAISNDDLPNLRGAYLQEYVGKNYKVAKPIILDGQSQQIQRGKQAGRCPDAVCRRLGSSQLAEHDKAEPGNSPGSAFVLSCSINYSRRRSTTKLWRFLFKHMGEFLARFICFALARHSPA